MTGWLPIVVGPASLIVGGVIALVGATWRENRAWIREQRRTVYVDFNHGLHEHFNTWATDPASLGDQPYNSLTDMWRQLAEVEVFGTPQAYRLAKEALGALFTMMRDGTVIDMGSREAFARQVRKDLKIPD